MAATATACPVSKAEFREHAEPIEITIAGHTITLDAKEFSTGSLGWYGNGKIRVVINGKPCTVQMGLNLTIVGSKEAK